MVIVWVFEMLIMFNGNNVNGNTLCDLKSCSVSVRVNSSLFLVITSSHFQASFIWRSDTFPATLCLFLLWHYHFIRFISFFSYVHLFFPSVALSCCPLSAVCLSCASRSLSPAIVSIAPASLSLSLSRCAVADAFLNLLPVAGMCNDHGKTYALYTITVIRKNSDGSEDVWKTYRRYSDFHDFHMRITEQVRPLHHTSTIRSVSCAAFKLCSILKYLEGSTT